MFIHGENCACLSALQPVSTFLTLNFVFMQMPYKFLSMAFTIIKIYNLFASLLGFICLVKVKLTTSRVFIPAGSPGFSETTVCRDGTGSELQSGGMLSRTDISQ